MKFPGSNKLELNMATTGELIAKHLEQSFAAQGVRVTGVEVSGSYSAKTLDVTFTTDPDPEVPPPIPEPAPVRGYTPPMMMTTVIADDGGPF